MGNPGSFGYLVTQLFSSQLLGLYPDYSATPITLLCGVVVFSYLGLASHPGLALGILDYGTAMHGTLSKHMHYIDKQLQE